MARPLYLAVDVSPSTWSGEVHGSAFINSLTEIIEMEPKREIIKLTIMQFSDRVATISRMLDVAEISVKWREKVAARETSFSALFVELRLQIEEDVINLAALGFAVRRPQIVIVSDGWATDDWVGNHATLTRYDTELENGFPWFPWIMTIGVGEFDRDALQAMNIPHGADSTMSVDEPLVVQNTVHFMIQSSTDLLPMLTSPGDQRNGHVGSPQFTPPNDEDLDDWI